MKKWIISVVSFLLTLALTAFIGFYAAIILIGPHSDLLPGWLHIPVAIFLWVIVLVIPIWLSRKVFEKFNIKEKKEL